MLTIPRRKFTLAVITYLGTDLSLPVGDAEAPDGGGWLGEINDSDFVPYVVVVPSQSNDMTGPSFTGPQEDVVFNYNLISYGISREQCEWIADRARASCQGLSKTDVTVSDTLDMRVQAVWTETYGAVQPDHASEPNYYSQADTLGFQLTPA